MSKLKQKYKNLIPNFWLDHLSKWRYRPEKSSFFGQGMKEVFESIYQNNHWGGSESKSGQGSTFESSLKAKNAVETILTDYNIQSVLDIPCGDFNWMKEIDLNSINYTGCDIVDELIIENQKKYQTGNIAFELKDITKDPLDKFDLVIVRDLFVHFSFDEIARSLDTIKNSGSIYLLATTFPELTVNYNIQTGDWRPVNLMKKPFSFPDPLLIFEESFHPEYKKEVRGKSLALWEIKNL